LRLRSLTRRRPSAAIVISSLALFVSLGGVGYAAASLSHNSVGGYQLRDGSVSYKKIVPGAVGVVRANTGQLQVRVSGSCANGTAIGNVDRAGKVTCNPALPSEFATSGSQAVTTSPTSVATLGLPSGASYLSFANPSADVKGTSAGTATVTCTLTDGANSQSRSATVDTDAAGTTKSVSIPLQVAGPAGSATLSCQTANTGATAPTVNVTSAINALQTSSNN
jgi:hypothetical protein